METWQNYVARFSSLLVSGVILSACYTPIATPTQSEVVTEPVASEVIETEVPTLEITVTDTPTATPEPSPTPRSAPEEVSMEQIDEMCPVWPETQLYLVEEIPLGDLISVGSKCYSGAGESEATIEDGIVAHLADQGIIPGDKYQEMDELIKGPVEIYLNLREDLDGLGITPINTSTPEPLKLASVLNKFQGVNSWMDINPQKGMIQNWPGVTGGQNDFDQGVCHWTVDGHNGYDLRSMPGSPAFPALDGIVSSIAVNQENGGYIIMMEHRLNALTDTGHVLPILTEEGITFDELKSLIEQGVISPRGVIQDKSALIDKGYEILEVGDPVKVGVPYGITFGNVPEGYDIRNGTFSTSSGPNQWIYFFRINISGRPVDPCYEKLWAPEVQDMICVTYNQKCK